jgi:WhiB family redox-sensing transcriptional regulator
MRDPRNYENPLCAQVGTDTFYPEDIGPGKYEFIQSAKTVCGGCQHRFECAEWAIHYEEYGIWGGLTGNQRRLIRRKRGIRMRREESA